MLQVLYTLSFRVLAIVINQLQDSSNNSVHFNKKGTYLCSINHSFL